MIANKYISTKELRLLISTAFLIFVVSAFSITSEGISYYNKQIIEQQRNFRNEVNGTGSAFTVYAMSNDNRPFSRLLILLLSFLIFLSLFNTDRFLIPISLSFLSFLVYLGWHVGIAHRLVVNRIETENFLEILLMIANYFDYLATFGITIILLWQFSILFRMLFSGKQTHELLP